MGTAIPAKISILRISELFDIKWTITKPSKLGTVVLDLNSTLNTICRVDGLAEYTVEQYISEINMMLRTFIHSNLDKKVVIIYNKEKTYMKEAMGDGYLSFFYDKRPMISDKIINHFIGKIEQLKEISNVKVINAGKFEPAILIFMILAHDDNTLIISRNQIVLQLISHGGIFWDGRFMYHKSLDPSKIYSAVDLKSKYKFPRVLPFSLYPYFICIRGLIDHGYSGTPGYGDKKTLEHLKTHLRDILNGTDTVINKKVFQNMYPPAFINNVVATDEKIKEEFVKIKDSL